MIIEFGRFAEDSRKDRGEGKPESFDFLGFTHICGKTAKGKFKIKRITSRKKLKSKKQNVKKWLAENMHINVKLLIDRLNQKLVGHYRYYGVSENSLHINKFRDYVIRQLFKTLNRRGQKHKYSWDKYKSRILAKFPVKHPKIYVNLYL
jgi:hypothetical protein